MLLARYTNWNRPCSALWRRLRLQRVKMRNDAIDVKVNKGLLTFGAEEEGAVGGVAHEEIIGEDGGVAVWRRRAKPASRSGAASV